MNDVRAYAHIGAEMMMKRHQAKINKVESLFRDHDIYPMLSHDTRENLHNVITTHTQELANAERFLRDESGAQVKRK